MPDVDRWRRRGWRAYADGRRLLRRSGSASPALQAFGSPNRSEQDSWAAATLEGHQRYRLAHPVPNASVAIVCVSNRPHLLADVVENIGRQAALGLQPDVVFVANASGFECEVVDAAFAAFANVRIDHPPANTSLGEGLNRAMALTDARFVAKFDDDDHYGADFLADSLRAHTYAVAGVVGKHSYYAHLLQGDETILRFPGHEFSYSSTLAGGTLVIDRTLVDDQQFDDISLGEDRAFIAQCHRRGISTFSADRFNYTQVRGQDNTWRPRLDDFLIDTRWISAGRAASEIDR